MMADFGETSIEVAQWVKVDVRKTWKIQQSNTDGY
jgi:hypothetical protein